MSKVKVTAEDSIDFLVATQVNATVMEAQSHPVGSGEPSHNAYTLLHGLNPSNDALWLEVNAEVGLISGVVVLGRHGFGQTIRSQDRFCPSHVVRQALCWCQRDRLADAALDR